MRRYRAMRIISILAIAFLATVVGGCGSKNLVNVWNENISDPEGVWEATALKNFNPDSVATMTAVIMAVHPMWLGDGLGFYTYEEQNGQKIPKYHRRTAWLALIFDGKSYDTYPAIINKFGTGLFVLCAGKDKSQLSGKNIIILSGSRKFAMTANQKVAIINANDLVSNTEARERFFRENPSKIKEDMLINVSSNTRRGNQFMVTIKTMFSEEVIIDGHEVLISGSFEDFKEAVKISNHSTATQRIIDSLSARISVQSIALPYLEIARIFVTLTLAAADNTMQGSFFESKVNGYQAGQALEPYLNNCKKELTKLKLENIGLMRKLLETQEYLKGENRDEEISIGRAF